MVNDSTSNGSTATDEPVSIDIQLDQLLVEAEAIKTVAQDQLADIKTLCTKIKTVQREHRASNREMLTIRQTLKGLQSMKL